MLNLTWLRSLVAVLENGQFQYAAKKLGLAQPTLSQHIQKLEAQLGVPLIQRSRTVCLATIAGERLLPYAESLLRISEQAMNAINHQQIRLGASSNIGIYMLQPYIHQYMQEQPEDDLQMMIDANPRIADKLLNAELDIALMEWWQPTATFDSLLWKEEPLVLITPKDHPLASLKSVSRELLSGLSLIGGEPGSGTGRLLKTYLQKQPNMPKITMQLGSTEAVKRAVIAGVGMSLVLRASVINEQQRGELAVIPLADNALMKPIHLVWRQSGDLQGKYPDFVTHLIQSGI
ncbi:MAG: LysR family transcriptional regulator [Methylophaga sp.]|nr:LysR family transcriptional regulator [Methylophaga sp.]